MSHIDAGSEGLAKLWTGLSCGGTYPEIEPYASRLLDVGDGHRVYWEASGNPEGAPALVLHGGPWSGCQPGLRRFFDPSRCRIVLFDQRGCGRSLLFAGEADADPEPANQGSSRTRAPLCCRLDISRCGRTAVALMDIRSMSMARGCTGDVTCWMSE